MATRNVNMQRGSYKDDLSSSRSDLVFESADSEDLDRGSDLGFDYDAYEPPVKAKP